MVTPTFALIARKGGVGKTSLCLNLAGAALDDGAKQVLVIDMDSQATLSKALLGPEAVGRLRPDQTVEAVAERSRTAGDVARETEIPGLWIVPSYPDLRVRPDGALNLAGIDPSLTFIDTPPDTRDTSTRVALLASHAAISPLVPEAWAMQSVPEVQKLLMGNGLVSNSQLCFAGYLLNMVQRVAMHTLCADTMQRLHGGSTFKQQVPAAVAYKEAAAAGRPVTHHSPKSAAAKTVRAVFAELLDRMESLVSRGAA